MSQRQYLSILDVRAEFQVVRIFEIFSHHKAGEAPRQLVWEVIRQFINTTGKLHIVARNRRLSYYMDSFNGGLEIRKPDKWDGDKFDLWPNKIWPKIKCLPEFERNGYKCKIDGISPYRIFKNIVSDNIAETLIKTKQYGLLAARVGNKSEKVYKYWDSVKICLRNNYIIKVDDVITWIDYLDLLVYFKKDIRNPTFVCPVNLKMEHDKLVAKKTEIDNRHRYTGLLIGLGKDRSLIKNMSGAGLKAEYDRIIEERNEIQRAKDLLQKIKQLEQEQAAYDRAKKAFFGLVFSSENITIKVMESIQEFIDEGDAHKHCVFTNKYYAKEESLILSAKVDGKPVETIEIDLSKMTIVQSRGLKNKASNINSKIISLMKKNMPAIKKRLKQTKNIAA